MNEVLTLIKRTPGTDEISKREVFCSLRSVGVREFYQAHAVDLHPEAVFVLTDYLDYEGETLADHDGQRYRVLRTYRKGQEMELVVVSASEEEARL